MLLNNTKYFEFMKMLCRICAKEDSNAIPIFGEVAQKSNIRRKIKSCLPITIEEDDQYPKQICLTCLSKLEDFWTLQLTCKEAQTKIEKKFYSLRSNTDQENSAPDPEDEMCGKCHKPVLSDENGVGCDGPCKKWYHCHCIKMTNFAYYRLMEDPNSTWMCEECKKTFPHKKIIRSTPRIEEKLKNLTESYPVSYGDSAVICLAREATPPPVVTTHSTVTRESQLISQAAPGEPVMAPLTFLAPAPASAPAVAPAASAQPPPDEVYPQALIQRTGEETIVYHNVPVPAAVPAPTETPRRRATVAQSIPIPKPMTLPSPATTTTTATAQRAIPNPLKRQNSDTSNNSNAKKMCVYCNKYFTDDIIDHHVSLHLRQSFSSCVECGKNFRSEEAMTRHRCGDKKESETICLDADDDELVIL